MKSYNFLRPLVHDYNRDGIKALEEYEPISKWKVIVKSRNAFYFLWSEFTFLATLPFDTTIVLKPFLEKERLVIRKDLEKKTKIHIK